MTATGFGAGNIPRAPGTAGTLVGIPVYLVFSYFPWPLYLMSVLALAFLGVFVSQEAEKMCGVKDPSWIVIDEIVGFQCTMFLIGPTVAHITAGFVLFRIFDIVKPFPIRLFEKRIPGGYGVVGDDIIAGIYSNILLLALVRLAGI